VASEPTVSLLSARCWAGPYARVRLCAVLIKATCENACGKFPTWRLALGSYSSASSPTSLRKLSNRSNIARASS
jgi:hypothetical protein